MSDSTRSKYVMYAMALGTNAPELGPEKQQAGGQERGQKRSRNGHGQEERPDIHGSQFRLACPICIKKDTFRVASRIRLGAVYYAFSSRLRHSAAGLGTDAHAAAYSAGVISATSPLAIAAGKSVATGS